jgi:hypothetical protein
MKAGDLIQFTVPGNRDEKAEIVRGLVIKDVGFNVSLQEQAVRVYWFDSDMYTTERKNNSPQIYEVISEGR